MDGTGARCRVSLLLLWVVLLSISVAPTSTVSGEDPVILISYPLDGSTFRATEKVPLNASESYDPDMTGLTVHWSSNKDGDLGYGAVLERKLSPGGHVITCEVVDGDGESATETRTITIIPLEPPVAILEANKEMVEIFEVVTFTADRSVDPDFDIVSFNFDFGDGSSTGWVQSNITSHSYSFPTTYTVRLDVKDTDGLTASTNLTITVRGRTDVEDDTSGDETILILALVIGGVLALVVAVLIIRASRRRRAREEERVRRRMRKAGMSDEYPSEMAAAVLATKGPVGHKVRTPKRREDARRGRGNKWAGSGKGPARRRRVGTKVRVKRE